MVEVLSSLQLSQNEPRVTQNLPKLTKLTKIVRIQSTTMDQS